jgi:hypothetical protein
LPLPMSLLYTPSVDNSYAPPERCAIDLRGGSRRHRRTQRAGAGAKAGAGRFARSLWPSDAARRAGPARAPAAAAAAPPRTLGAGHAAGVRQLTFVNLRGATAAGARLGRGLAAARRAPPGRAGRAPRARACWSNAYWSNGPGGPSRPGPRGAAAAARARGDGGGRAAARAGGRSATRAPRARGAAAAGAGRGRAQGRAGRAAGAWGPAGFEWLQGYAGRVQAPRRLPASHSESCAERLPQLQRQGERQVLVSGRGGGERRGRAAAHGPAGLGQLVRREGRDVSS